MLLTTLKSIARRMPFENIPFHYYNPNGNEQFLLHFETISEEYRSEYYSLAETERTKYISNSARIYVPNMYISKYCSTYKNDDPPTWNYTMERIHKLGILELSTDEAGDMFAIYGILHEIGHWMHFNDVGRNVWAFLQDNAGAEEVHRLKQQLNDIISTQKKVSPIFIKKEVKRLLDMYYSVSNEKIANEFADKEFPRVWKLINGL